MALDRGVDRRQRVRDPGQLRLVPGRLRNRAAAANVVGPPLQVRDAQRAESSVPLQSELQRLRLAVFDRPIERGVHDRLSKGLWSPRLRPRRRLCLRPWQRASRSPRTSRWGTKNPDEDEVERLARVVAAEVAVAVARPGTLLVFPFTVEDEAVAEAVVGVAAAVVAVVTMTTLRTRVAGTTPEKRRIAASIAVVVKRSTPDGSRTLHRRDNDDQYHHHHL